MNLPNKLTMLRIILIPFFAAAFYLPDTMAAKNFILAIIFVAAYITDALDGDIARKRNMVTDFGKFMDPIADKLLTAAAIIFMQAKGMFYEPFGVLFVFITIAREFIISGLRLVAAGKGTVIAADKLGKLKTVFQFITITLILVDGYVFAWGLLPISVKPYIDNTFICITLVLTVWSMISYLVKNRSVFSQMK